MKSSCFLWKILILSQQLSFFVIVVNVFAAVVEPKLINNLVRLAVTILIRFPDLIFSTWGFLIVLQWNKMKRSQWWQIWTGLIIFAWNASFAVGLTGFILSFIFSKYFFKERCKMENMFHYMKFMEKAMYNFIVDTLFLKDLKLSW